MPAASQLATRVADVLAEQHLLDGVDRLLVGFSGGADSTALLLLLSELGLPLVAHHFHHGLRGTAADEDAAWCEQFCAQRGLPFALHHLRVPEQRHSREGTEAAARRCRLESWQELCGSREAVVLGHHASDAVEDLLLRLARGANASGLTALRPRRELAGVLFLRPLLELRHEELCAYLREQGVEDWREDHTNADPVHRRNAVRHQLLPAFQTVFDGDAGLHRALAALREDADYLEAQAAAALRPAMTPDDWRQLPPALLPRVLRLWLQQETGGDTPPQHTDIARLRHELSRPLARPVELPLAAGPALILDSTGLHLKASPQALPERLWHWQEDPVLSLPEIHAELAVDPTGTIPGETFALDQLPPVLTVRSRRPGDRLVPFGSSTPKKLQDLLVDAHVPRAERDAVPLLLAGDTIIWVPGLRRAEFGRVQSDEPSVRLSFRPARG